MEERPGERAHELRRWRKGVYASELTQEKRPSAVRVRTRMGVTRRERKSDGCEECKVHHADGSGRQMTSWRGTSRVLQEASMCEMCALYYVHVPASRMSHTQRRIQA